MNYNEVLKYLEKASVKGSVLGLSRIEDLLELLGNPQDKLKIIHVSGTNGKGSFSAMLSAILYEAGYKVGSFSSPSLVTLNDSFRLNCKIVSDDYFAEVLSEVIEKAGSISDSPTEFELLTAAAFQMFCKSNCDICIIECGLGGDTDSTNVIKKPVLSVITNAQLDHCGILGNTLSEIAAHKAGIIKQGCNVLYGGEQGEAYGIIKSYADKMKSKLYVTDKTEISGVRCDINGTKLSYGEYDGLQLSLVGTYQAENVANVITAVEILKKKGLEISKDSVYSGLANTEWQGRFEVIRKNPPVIFDGAHNPCGMEEAVKTIKSCFGNQKIAVLMGVMADKEYNLYADMLKDVTDIVFTVTPDNPRSLEANKLADYFNKKGICAVACEKFSDGLEKAVDYAENKNMPLVVMGSLYMYREFKDNF